MTVAGDRQMPAIVGLHGFHGLFQAGRFVDGGHLGAHDQAHRRAFGIAALHHDPLHEIALAENAAQLVAVKNQDGSDVEIRHFPGNFRYGMMLFDAEELTLTHDVADTGHTHPPR